MSKKIAVICMAYLRKVEGVTLLADFFSKANADLFIHVDAKVDDEVYKTVAKAWPCVSLLPDRHKIFWGGFNTVQAIVSSLKHARSVGEYDRFLILTEDTVPVVSRDEFKNRMIWEGEFIESKSITSGEVLSRYAGFFYLDSFATTPRPCRTAERVVTDKFLVDIERLRSLQIKGKVILPEIYHGSVWCGLSANATDKILNSYFQDLHLKESFEFSAVPEEQYFQTILGPIAKKQPLIFTDWSRKPTPFVFSSIQEILNIDKKNALFLRKVTFGDPEVIDFIRSQF